MRRATSLSGDSLTERLRAVPSRDATPAPSQAPPWQAGMAVPAELRGHKDYEVLRELSRGGMKPR